MTYKRVSHLAARKQVLLCECGDHAWAILTRGYVTLVSPEDVHLLSENAWQAHMKPDWSKVYAGSGSKRLHRVILKTESLVDHENGNGLDNRRVNLRPGTKIQNAQNSSCHHDSTSKYKGVFWDGARQKWRVQIQVSGRQIYLGRFHNEIFAAGKYDEAAIKHFGEFARTNF